MFVKLPICDKSIVTRSGRNGDYRKIIFWNVVVTWATVGRAAWRAACHAGALRAAVFVITGTRARRLALHALAFTGATIVFARAVFLVAGIVAIATIRRAARHAVALHIAVFMSSGTRARRLALLAFAFTGATIVSARARRFFRIIGFVAIATVRRAARDAIALHIAVLVSAGTRARRLALLTLAFTGAAIVCARTVFLRIFFFVAVRAVFESTVALAVVVFMRAMRSVGAFFTFASMFTAIFSALALFFFGCIVASATERTNSAVTRRVTVFVFTVFGFSFVFTHFAFASMRTAIVNARARRFMTVASVGSFAALGAAPLTANALATTTSAAFTAGVGGFNVVLPIAKIAAAHPLD